MKNRVIVTISLLAIVLLASLLVIGAGCAPTAPQNKTNATKQNQTQAQNQAQTQFATQMQSVMFDSQYTAQHYSNFSDSEGVRILDITYMIKDKSIVYCDGAFVSYMKTRGNDNIVCDIVVLKNNGFNAGPNYFTQENISARIKDFKPTQFVKEDGENCFSTSEDKVCFENNKIVAYTHQGNPYWDWEIIR